MPYLSDAWSLPEVVCWVVARDPNSLMAAPGNVREIALLASSHLHTGKAPTGNALDDVILAILSGRVSARARNVQTGQIQLIPARELNALEFYVATDIPGSPFGFRGVSDQVLKWVSPMVSAANALTCWPRHRAARTAPSIR
jgi:hypothetical protein